MVCGVPVDGCVTTGPEPEPEVLLQWKLDRSLEPQSKHASCEITVRFPTADDWSEVQACKIEDPFDL